MRFAPKRCANLRFELLRRLDDDPDGSPLAYLGTSFRGTITSMKVDKMSISLAPDLGDKVRQAADRTGRGLSAWLAEAASAKLRTEALAEFLDQWERKHGKLTAKELRIAEAELALSRVVAP